MRLDWKFLPALLRSKLTCPSSEREVALGFLTADAVFCVTVDVRKSRVSSLLSSVPDGPDEEDVSERRDNLSLPLGGEDSEDGEVCAFPRASAECRRGDPESGLCRGGRGGVTDKEVDVETLVAEPILWVDGRKADGGVAGRMDGRKVEKACGWSWVVGEDVKLEPEDALGPLSVGGSARLVALRLAA